MVYLKYLSFLLISLTLSLSNAANLPSGFVEEMVLDKLDPTHCKISPDGRVFVTEKFGRINVIKNGVALEEPFMEIEVNSLAERGLMDIEFDPNFTDNNYFYIFYTLDTEEGAKNRVSRFTANGDKAIIDSEFILLETNVLNASMHNGGSLIFGHDGYLFITIGDDANPNNSQSLNTINGKVLRVNADGTIPESNPFYDLTSGVNKSIYALGLRNPYQASIDPLSGKIYINEVGLSSYEEINELKKGANYGWPAVEGYATVDPEIENYEDPLFSYFQEGEYCAVTGGVFYNPEVSSFPEIYKGKYLFMDFCVHDVRMFNPVDSSVTHFFDGMWHPIDMAVAPNGDLYYLMRRSISQDPSPVGQLWKVSYQGSGKPHISFDPSDQIEIVGSSISFTFGVSGDSPFTYQWQKDGKDIDGANEEVLSIENISLSDQGNYRVIVKNSISSDTSNPAFLEVSESEKPVATILTPEINSTYQAGMSIEFSGKGFDNEDGVIPVENMSWRIDFHHDLHSHPAMPQTFGIYSGTFGIPVIGETSSDVWYRLYLTVKDSDGFVNTIYRDVYPVVSTITLTSEPFQEIPITLDGYTFQTPYTFEGVAGVKRAIEAPNSISYNGQYYEFKEWKNGGSRVNLITTPSSDSIYTAVYDVITSNRPMTRSQSLSIFPNPAKNSLEVKLVELNGNYPSSLTIFDYLGRTIKEIVINKNTSSELIELNLEDYANGYYFLNVNFPTEIQTSHFVISK